MNGDGEGERSMKEIWGGEPLGLNANIRIYRYSKGQFFAQHCKFFSFFFNLLLSVWFLAPV